MRKKLKHQTRRLASDDDQVEVFSSVTDHPDAVATWDALPFEFMGAEHAGACVFRVGDIPDELIPDNGLDIHAIYKGGRLYLRRQRDYAIAPGRGKHQVGRFFCDQLRLQRMGDISEFDLLEEGFERDDKFVSGEGTQGEFVAVVKGREIRSQHAGPMFITVLNRLHGKKFDKGRRVIAIGIGACTWKGE